MSVSHGIQRYREAARSSKNAAPAKAKPTVQIPVKAVANAKTPEKNSDKNNDKNQGKQPEKKAAPAAKNAKADLKGKPVAQADAQTDAAIDEHETAKLAAQEEALIQKEIADELAREEAQTSRLVKSDLSPVNCNRDQLVIEYAPLIKYISQKIAARLPANIELDDLMSSGVIGLMDAIEKYDASRDNKFKTYAEFRIRGAILDELRAQDWVPRSVREKAKVLERVYSKIEQTKGRQATDEEVCEELRISQDEYHDLLNQVRSVSLLSYDDLSNFSKQDKRALHGLGDASNSKAHTPFSEVNVASVKKLIAEAINDLPEKQRLVLSLYYYEDLNLKEIGRVLDVTESRVSQLHTQAIIRLKGRLRNHWDEFITLFG